MRVALDSNVFMYALGFEEHWGKAAYDLLKRMETGKLTGLAASICMMEVLAKPFQHSPEAGQEAQLFLESLQGVDFFPADIETAIVAGRLRGRFGRKLKPIDALHLATAVVQQADLFVTNDQELAAITVADLRVVRLGEDL